MADAYSILYHYQFPTKHPNYHLNYQFWAYWYYQSISQNTDLCDPTCDFCTLNRPSRSPTNWMLQLRTEGSLGHVSQTKIPKKSKGLSCLKNILIFTNLWSLTSSLDVSQTGRPQVQTSALLQRPSGSPHFTDDQAEAQTVCSPQHFPRSQQIFKRPFAFYLTYCIYSKRCSIPKAQRLCLHSTSPTAGVVERRHSSYVVISGEIPEGPIRQQCSPAKRQCQAWGPYATPMWFLSKPWQVAL